MRADVVLGSVGKKARSSQTVSQGRESQDRPWTGLGRQLCLEEEPQCAEALLDGFHSSFVFLL